MKKQLQEYLTLLHSRPSSQTEDGMLELIDDPALLEAYSREHHIQLGIVFRSKHHIYVVDLMRDKTGKIFPYERLLKAVTGSSIVVVPICDDKLVLLKQYRHALGEYQYCFPRGFAEDNLTPGENARKELCEELRCIPGTPKLLGQVVADSGICGEKVWVFQCSITEPYTDGIYENIHSCIKVTFLELKRMVRMGQINDGFTLAAIALLQNNPVEDA